MTEENMVAPAEETLDPLLPTYENKVDALLASKLAGNIWPAPGFDGDCIPLPEDE